MIYRINKKLKRVAVKIVGLINGVNTKKYWDHRFSSNWEIQNGRTQSTLFAAGFVLTDFAKKIEPTSVLDFGCGLADSIPVLKMAYPKSKLYYYDFSTVAMQKAGEHIGELASPFSLGTPLKVDLVYTSNVIEHITDSQLPEFLNSIMELVQKYVVIQAPFNELLSNGTKISAINKSEESEHERTIDLSFVDYLKVQFPNLDWGYELSKVPIAWNKGEQIFIIGTLKSV